MSFRPETALNPRALRRESIQLAVLAAVSVAAVIVGNTVFEIVAGILDVLAALLTAIAAIVAWRVGGRAAALGLYLVAAVVFAALAAVNFAG